MFVYGKIYFNVISRSPKFGHSKFRHVLESGPYSGVLLNISYGYFANFDAEGRKCVTYMLFC